MKKSITVNYEEEKLTALKVYFRQKGVSLEEELEKSMETLYNKAVPSAVKDYIELKTGIEQKASFVDRNGIKRTGQ